MSNVTRYSQIARGLMIYTIISTLSGFMWSDMAAAGPGDISTVAGGYTGDGGPATSARINKPSHIAVDASGSVYIVDTYNQRIRMVSATTGSIITVVGNGTSAFAGDGGPATSASISESKGMAVDSSGNIYIADSLNQRIRKVNASSGVISTIAGNGSYGFSGDGGDPLFAIMNYPYSVATDSSGNIYIADSNNHRIRKVDAFLTTISTVAGNGTGTYAGDGGSAVLASLNYPTDVDVDEQGNIYIADTFNSRIRKVGTDGIIVTVAGNGTAGYSSGDEGVDAVTASLNIPYGIALQTTGDLYIADTYNQRIRKVDAAGHISTVAGGGWGYAGDGGPATSASMINPTDVALDVDGNIYIADQLNDCIRMVRHADNIISTIAGNPNSTFYGDSGPATAASLNTPHGVVPDSLGNIYISDTKNMRIRKVDMSGIIITVAGDGTIGYDPAQNGGSAVAAKLNYPYGISVDPDGNPLIADSNNHRIRKIDSTAGTITTIAGDGNATYAGDGNDAILASLNNPLHVATDSAGNIYIADAGNHRVRMISASSGTITTFAGNGNAAYSGDGEDARSASLNNPTAVALDASGNLYIADAGNNVIRKVDTTGTISTLAGNGSWGYSGDGGDPRDATFATPFGVAVDPAGTIYIADFYNSRIRKISENVISTLTGNGTYGFAGDGGPAASGILHNPYSIAVDAAGNLFFTDVNNWRIRKIVESIPPSGTVSITPNIGSAGFTSFQAVTLALSCTDGGECAEMQFSDNGSGYTSLESFTTSKPWRLADGLDGIRTVYARFTDTAGNLSSVVTATITLDTNRPVTTATAVGFTFDTWTSAASTTVTLAAIDPVINGTSSGITAGYPRYCVDTANSCTPSLSYASSISVTCAAGATCTQYVRYQAADIAGNVEMIKSQIVKQDRLAPSTVISATSYTFGTWTSSSPVTATLSASDGGAGGVSIKYCIDAANACDPATTYSAPFNITCTAGQACTQYVRYLAIDNLNNTETVKSSMVRQDLLPPVTTAAASGYTFSSWTSSATVTVTLSAVDPDSGVAGVPQYCVDSVNGCTPGSAYGSGIPVTCAAGSVCAQYVRYRASDSAGNAEAVKSSQVRQDRLPPVTTAEAAGYTFGTSTSSAQVEVTLTATDGGGSGIASGFPKYCIATTNTCTPNVTYGAAFNVACTAGSVCTQYVRYQSSDAVGNTETVKYQTVIQDRQAPTLNTTASYVDSTHVDVTFSEAVTGAATAANYSVDKGLAVTNAILQSGSTYRLTTGVQAVGTTYTVIASTVNIKDLVGNTLSAGAATATFTRQSASNTSPTTPVLSGPATNSETANTTPTLIVVNSTDIDNDTVRYEFEVDTVNTFDSGSKQSAVNVAAGAGTTSWTPSVLVDNTTYYWRVRATDGDKTSLWMTTANVFINTVNDIPAVPAVSSPSNNSQVSSLTPLVSITNSSDTDRFDTVTYDFDIATDSGFLNIVANVIGQAQGPGTTQFQSSSLTDNMRHYWRARSRDNHGAMSNWVSASFIVNTSNDAPTTPTLSAPANTSELAVVTPQLTVVNSTDLDGDSLQYVFEVDTVNTFSSPDKQASGFLVPGIGATSWTPAALTDNTTWYWRAKATDSLADSSWMATASFFVNTANDAPTAPALSNPANNGAVTVLAPTLQVVPATDPDRDALTYEYEVYSDSGLTNHVTNITGAGTSWTVNPSLNDNTWYWWRARAGDIHGTPGPWMTTGRFFVNNNGYNDPPSVTVTSPVVAEPIVVGNTFTISWSAADPDSDPIITLYYDMVGSGHSGTQIAAGIHMSETASHAWDITGLAEGIYYVYAMIDDGTTVSYAYAPGPVTRMNNNGDTDDDNDVDIFDALKALRFAVGLDQSVPADVAHADVAPLVNGKPAPDGRIDLSDVVVILRKAAGLTSW